MVHSPPLSPFAFRPGFGALPVEGKGKTHTNESTQSRDSPAPVEVGSVSVVDKRVSEEEFIDEEEQSRQHHAENNQPRTIFGVGPSGTSCVVLFTCAIVLLAVVEGVRMATATRPDPNPEPFLTATPTTTTSHPHLTLAPTTSMETPKPSQTFVPTESPTVAGTMDPFTSLVRSIVVSFFGDAFPSSTAQEDALAWLVSDEQANNNNVTSVDVDSDPVRLRLLERYVAALFYNATGGIDWQGNESWRSGQHVCTWAHLGCKDDERIAAIHMYWNNLTGTVPTELGLLTELTGLDLGGSSLTGRVPTEMGLLTHLTEVFGLRSNQLTGRIPTELGLFTNLRSLDLGENGLVGEVPAELGQLTELELLRLDSNHLQGAIQTALGMVTELRWLYLNNNFFSGTLPTELGLLTKLEILELDQNSLSGRVPTELGLLTELTQLDLGRNFLSGTFPTELGLLTKLGSLHLEYNILSGTIPTELERLNCTIHILNAFLDCHGWRV